MFLNQVIATLTLLCCFNVEFVMMDETIAWDKCECAAFDFQADQLQPTVEPILSQNPLNITCNEAGSNTCQQMCIELVKLGKDRAPEVLCGVVKHSDGFRPSLYTRTCSGDWKFSGLTCEHVICCHDGLSIRCDKNSESTPDQ